MSNNIKKYIMKSLGLKPGKIVANSPYDLAATEAVLRRMVADGELQLTVDWKVVEPRK